MKFEAQLPRSVSAMFSLLATGSLIHGAIYALEGLFAFGIIGSALVVLLTSIEDFGEILKDDNRPETVTGD
jgi:hypothetical protein